MSDNNKKIRKPKKIHNSSDSLIKDISTITDQERNHVARDYNPMDAILSWLFGKRVEEGVLNTDLLYYLNEDHTYRPCEIEEWYYQIEKCRLEKSFRVAEDTINGKYISTVWLGVNHGYFIGKPLLFETKIFNGEIECDYYQRYSTWEEALEGHKEAIQWVLDCSVHFPEKCVPMKKISKKEFKAMYPAIDE